jgi:hypothetical protein
MLRRGIAGPDQRASYSLRAETDAALACCCKGCCRLIASHSEFRRGLCVVADDRRYRSLNDELEAWARIANVRAAPVGQPWLWTLAFGPVRRPHADARLRADVRGCDGGVHQELAARVEESPRTCRGLFI